MSAEVLAIGPFHRALGPMLGPPELHANTREGAVLIVPVFAAPEGSSRGRALAACLQVDPWDFNTHAFDPWAADIAALHRFHAYEVPRGAAVERFLALRAAGFEFHFLPNG